MPPSPRVRLAIVLSVAFRGLEIRLNPVTIGVLTYPTALTEKTCAIEVAMPAALSAAVRSSVFVLILFKLTK